jgi:hypothetical protein
VWNTAGTLLAVGNGDGSIELFDSTFRLLKKFTDHRKLINRIRWNPGTEKKTGSQGEFVCVMLIRHVRLCAITRDVVDNFSSNFSLFFKKDFLRWQHTQGVTKSNKREKFTIFVPFLLLLCIRDTNGSCPRSAHLNCFFICKFYNCFVQPRTVPICLHQRPTTRRSECTT